MKKKNVVASAGLVAIVLFALGMVSHVRAADQWEAPRGMQVRPYPDPAIKALDPSFKKYVPFNAEVERLGHGFRWVEGPVWFGDGRYLLFSDIPNNQMVKWEEETGRFSVYRKPSNYANGNTRDRQGRLISCEHGRRVTRTEPDGSITVLADSFQGKKLNSPNDAVVKSDGSIWFTDPAFGIGGFYEGYKAEMEQPCMGLYRIDGKSGDMTLVADDIKAPNGLAFSPDESVLYVVEGRATPSRLILAFDVTENGTKLTNKRPYIDFGKYQPDGFRVDSEGNLWVGCGGAFGDPNPDLNGVAVYNTEAKQIGFINTPERISNLTFGGEKKNRLLMAGSKSIYSLFVEAIGVAPGFNK